MARIAVGGFQHETNTFSPIKADLEDFKQAGAWPPLLRGDEMFGGVAGMNLAISGFIEAANAVGHTIVPLVWCSAGPSGPVTTRAFESVWDMVAEDLRRALPVDGMYLDLHGAMVTEHHDDGEGEILRRVRAIVGPSMPVVASLDTHANTTPAMVEHSSALVAYRTYPHVDMAGTGHRAAELMEMLLSTPSWFKHFCQIPFLIPLPWQCTDVEPMRSLMGEASERQARAGIVSLSFTPGFPLADVHDCGPSVFAYGSRKETVVDAVEGFRDLVLEREPDFVGRLYNPEEAVRRALDLSGAKAGPVILADTQDNPGAGGTADGVTIVKLLARENADAVVGIVFDPEVATQAHASGEGAVARVNLGGKSGVTGESPFWAECMVERLGDGNLTGTGPFYSGCHMNLGPMALLRFGRVRVVVASRKQQAADRAMFQHLGVEPEAEKILVLKSSVHFRADFSRIASEILMVEAPGYNVADPTKLAFQHLRPGLRVSPMGRPFGN